jgi:hypothetical protein
MFLFSDLEPNVVKGCRPASFPAAVETTCLISQVEKYTVCFALKILSVHFDTYSVALAMHAVLLRRAKTFSALLAFEKSSFRVTLFARVLECGTSLLSCLIGLDLIMKLNFHANFMQFVQNNCCYTLSTLLEAELFSGFFSKSEACSD